MEASYCITHQHRTRPQVLWIIAVSNIYSVSTVINRQPSFIYISIPHTQYSICTNYCCRYWVDSASVKLPTRVQERSFMQKVICTAYGSMCDICTVYGLGLRSPCDWTANTLYGAHGMIAGAVLVEKYHNSLRELCLESWKYKAKRVISVIIKLII